MDLKNYYELYKHQKQAVNLCKDRNYFALLFDTGTGKTPTTIQVLREKFHRDQNLYKTLIICPLSITEQWKEEWVKFGGEIYNERVEVLIGSGKKKVEKLKNHTGNILVTNIDSLNQKDVFAELMKWGPEAIVLDESHMIKSFNSKRTKAAIKLGKTAKFKYILTGTPQTNSLQDLWSQFNFLAPGEIFPDNFYVFRAQYFYDANGAKRGRMGSKYFPDYQVRPGAVDEVRDIIHRHSLVANKNECIDLPPFVKMTRKVELAQDQKKMYKEMENDFIAYLEGKACVASMAMVKGLRMQQLVAGIFKDDEGVVTRFKTNRTKVLEEVLEGIGKEKKIIIWSVFIDTYKDIEDVCKKVGLKSVMLTGQQSATQKQENIKAFREDDEVKVLIANQASGGTGLNLTEASYSIYYTRNFNLANDIQSEGRNYRSGSDMHDKVTRIDLVTQGTIDEHVLKSLKNKADVSKELLEYKKCT